MKTIKGNIFDGDWDGIAHCCNLFHTWGAGIAKQMKQRFPAAFAADEATIHGSENKLGNFSYADCNSITVFNLYAQIGVGNDGDPLNRNCQYDFIHDSLYRVCKHIEKNYPQESYILALPMIGCGLAGGDEKIVYAILESVESHFENIYFHLYKL